MSEETKPRLRQTSDGRWRAAPTSDSLRNVVSGLGTQADKRTHNEFTFGANFRDLGQLEAAYSGNWIARRIVQAPVDDALREWRSFSSEDAEELHKAEQALKMKEHVQEGAYWSRLYGGAAVIMITDQPLDEPLRLERIKKGSPLRLVSVDRWDIQPQQINFTDPLAEDFLMPEYYSVRHGTGIIHSSHVVRFDGEPLPRRLRQLNETWGDSILRKVLGDLTDMVSTKSGMAALVQEANVDVIYREGLSEEVTSDQQNAIIERFALAKMMASMINSTLLDKETEELDRKQITFSGLGDILDKLMVWMSGAADIPMTRLFGQSAAGMDATGEGDQNNYYDRLSSDQQRSYGPALEKIDQVLVRTVLGEYPEELSWEWNPLYQESGAELAQQDLARATSENTRLNDGVLRKSHVMARLKSEGRYAITEAEIEEQKKIEKEEDEMMKEAREAGFDPSEGGPLGQGEEPVSEGMNKQSASEEENPDEDDPDGGQKK